MTGYPSTLDMGPAGCRGQRTALEIGRPGEQGTPVETQSNDPANGRGPSIAVLPFQNLSTEARHEYAADGLVEDLIEAFSRIPTFFVISRLSTRIWPAVTSIKPSTALSSVVFPQPLGPTMQTSSPSKTLRSMPRNTGSTCLVLSL